MLFHYILGTLLLAISILATWWGIERTLQAEKTKSRSPFGEKLLRPAGESIRLKITDIRDGMLEEGMILSVCFVIPSLVLFLPPAGTPSPIWPAWSTVAAVCYTTAFFRWRRLFALRKDLRNYHLGYDGERYVAAELDSLRSSGFRVFHDFVVDWKPGGEKTNFNIDHIALGPCGIFAIETKARRKPNDPPSGSEKTHKASFSGTTLQFSGGYEDAKAIK